MSELRFDYPKETLEGLIGVEYGQYVCRDLREDSEGIAGVTSAALSDPDLPPTDGRCGYVFVHRLRGWHADPPECPRCGSPSVLLEVLVPAPAR